MKKVILILSLILSTGLAYSQYGGSYKAGSGFDPSKLTFGGNNEFTIRELYSCGYFSSGWL